MINKVPRMSKPSHHAPIQSSSPCLIDVPINYTMTQHVKVLFGLSVALNMFNIAGVTVEHTMYASVIEIEPIPDDSVGKYRAEGVEWAI